ncbi:MAG TPA: biopolymer transporter ExbD [Lacunisphaera sp.]|nr:biopolymer transporter ExbD [Lacunisphaera sp.]
MSGLYVKKRKRPEMNLVPLIDVLVMLIFFAFVTMQFRSVTTMNLTLPKAETAGKSELKESFTISVSKEGKMEVNGRPASMTDLEHLADEIGRVSKDITVLVRSDETAELRYALQAMDICRKHGLNKIRLQTR